MLSRWLTGKASLASSSYPFSQSWLRMFISTTQCLLWIYLNKEYPNCFLLLHHVCLGRWKIHRSSKALGPGKWRDSFPFHAWELSWAQWSWNTSESLFTDLSSGFWKTLWGRRDQLPIYLRDATSLFERAPKNKSTTNQIIQYLLSTSYVPSIELGAGKNYHNAYHILSIKKHHDNYTFYT